MIDATNPLADDPPTNGVLRFFTNFDESLMEHLQREFEQVCFVKPSIPSVMPAAVVSGPRRCPRDRQSDPWRL